MTAPGLGIAGVRGQGEGLAGGEGLRASEVCGGGTTGGTAWVLWIRKKPARGDPGMLSEGPS